MSKLLSTLVISVFASVVFGTTSHAAQTPVYDTETLMIVQPVTPKVEIKEVPAPVKETKQVEAPKKEVPKPAQPIVYKVKAGDTLTSIGKKYHVDWTRIWSKNKGLKNQDQLNVGQKLVIPNKKDKLKQRSIVKAHTAPVSRSSTKVAQVTTSKSESPYTASQSVTRPSTGEPNAYAYGWCTWWVKEKRPDIGGYWGDAGYNWLSEAQAAGFSTGAVPSAGAVGVTAGHVVYVESVSGGDVNISEMGYGYQANSAAHYRTVPASSFQYIY